MANPMIRYCERMKLISILTRSLTLGELVLSGRDMVSDDDPLFCFEMLKKVE